jgi:hypothetical protein
MNKRNNGRYPSKFIPSDVKITQIGITRKDEFHKVREFKVEKNDFSITCLVVELIVDIKISLICKNASDMAWLGKSGFFQEIEKITHGK